MRDLSGSHSDQLLVRVAHDLTVPVVGDLDLSVKADLRDADAGLLEDGAKTLLAFAQHPLGAPALPNVKHLPQDEGQRYGEETRTPRPPAAPLRGLQQIVGGP